MGDFERLRNWLAICPALRDMPGGQHVDWAAPNPGNYGIMPTGSTTIETLEDVVGGVIERRQYNIAIYAVGWTVDDVLRADNIGLVDGVQQWVAQQQWQGLAPKLGDDPDQEYISAANGMLYQLSEDGQTGLYQIQVTATYERHYTRE